ncbi:5-oxoprolinase subunit PxpB [Panacagrimonas sp.]|uniref:5-oxoprolinase subunit PxpB n=1 Tax=Panacagrimonas sp. TaxID=2480088 RepID=UPI003B529775
MSGPSPSLTCRPAGRDGLLVELHDPADVMPLYAEIHRRKPDGIIEVVPAARTVLIAGPGAAALARELPHWTLTPDAQVESREIEVPVIYDGTDLQSVATATGLTTAQVIELHSQADYRVAFCGFAPGFAYLSGLPQALHLPRRDTPRTAVPAGSVAIAGTYSGVYPRALPGGWQLLGRTDLALWNAARQPPALLLPGTRVRFVPRTG